MHPIRSLRSFEWDLYRDHMLALDHADRRLRFGHLMSDEAVSGFVDRINPSNTRILARFDADLRIVGAAQLSRLPHGDAELSFSVDPSWRRKGLGLALARRALLAARNKGIKQVCLFCLAENHPMRRLAFKAGLSVDRLGSECEATVSLPAPTPFSGFQGITGEQAGWYDFISKRNQRALLRSTHWRRAA
ncbi:MAG: GNAT family N-acetyltransferase [Hyphomicrobiales bacterium]|nr:GNAT family N-acetyltransferase [Hyphomicrobiales bacterium]